MAGSYVLKKSPEGQFYFLLYSGNGEVVLNSEMYLAKASAENGIASVQSNSAQDDRYSRNQASGGKFYFNLKAANHHVIGSSQMYNTTSARDAGIDAVKKNGPNTNIKDEA
jgi:uncharacterized protein YegP (UPF0339 family)